MPKKPTDRKLTFAGLDKAYVAGALCTQLAEMTRTPYAFPKRDPEIYIRLIDEARAAIGRDNLDAATEARMDRIVAAAERALEAGKFQGDEG